MDSIVTFRNFELRDVDFVYRAKNDKRVNDTIIGDYNNFSFEDAIEWVKGCMNQTSNYKYWVVCTNDDNQNIVGWCGISNIDLKNSSAYFRTITIYHAQYRDTVTWYHTWTFILDYVFNTLKLNRLSATCNPFNKLNYQVLELFPNAYEGIMKQALCKNGKYYDVSIYGIMREEYLLSKSKGHLDFEYVQSQLKRDIRDKQRQITNINEFIERFTQELDQTDPSTITPKTKFRELDEWSSLLAVDLVAIAEGGLLSNFDMNDLNKCETIQDLYEMIKQREKA